MRLTNQEKIAARMRKEFLVKTTNEEIDEDLVNLDVKLALNTGSGLRYKILKDFKKKFVDQLKQEMSFSFMGSELHKINKIIDEFAYYTEEGKEK